MQFVLFSIHLMWD